MALSDPQSVTINAVAASLPRVSSGLNSSTYQSNDGTVSEVISHAYDKRKARRVFRINHSKVAPDPFATGQNLRYDMSAYLVVQVPTTGYTVTEQKQVIDGFIAQLNASSGALITKLLGGEN